MSALANAVTNNTTAPARLEEAAWSELIALVHTLGTEDITALGDVLRERQSELRDASARQVTRGVRTGSTVTVADGVRPLYIAGAVVEVVRRNPKSFVVRFPNEPRYRRYAGTEVRLPLSLVANG